MLKISYSVLCLYMALFTDSVVADDTVQLDRAVKAITNSLPVGWTIAERKPDQIPHGHHWNENYTGPKGFLLIVKGIRPVDAEFSDAHEKWNAIHVATESLEIWVMPGNYRDSFFRWLSIGRPIPPTVVLKRSTVKVYARPSHVLISKQQFWRILSKSNGVMWPDSPVNSPELLSWKNWRLNLEEAVKKEFAK